ncbi:MAG: glycosyltransferase [Lachnospiraceae bacterium]|nr:glycosyltransferase [Lachnospiraceae bacterium]
MGEISIIIPFYNAQEYLESCTDSLKKQTYPYFRAYFIDDGSTDDSVQRLKDFTDDRFIILRQQHMGVSAARNLGLKHSDGDWLSFMDVDDELMPNYLEELIKAAKNNQVDVVLCNFWERYSGGKMKRVLLPWDNTVIGQTEIQDILIPRMIGVKHDADAILGFVWRTFMTRSFWESTGIRFDEKISRAEDQIFLLTIYNQAERICILKECLYIYHKSTISTMNLFDSAAREHFEVYHSAIESFLKTEGLFSKNLARYQANRSYGYTTMISNLARNPDFIDSYQQCRHLREQFLLEACDYKSNGYLSWLRKLSLWMLEQKMYLLLLILYKIKEKIRVRNFLRL